MLWVIVGSTTGVIPAGGCVADSPAPSVGAVGAGAGRAASMAGAGVSMVSVTYCKCGKPKDVDTVKTQKPQYVLDLRTSGAICESVAAAVVVCAFARAVCGPLWALRASPGQGITLAARA